MLREDLQADSTTTKNEGERNSQLNPTEPEKDALLESQRAYQTLLSNLPGVAYRCRNDAQWTMEYVSDGCLELTGYTAVELVEIQAVAYADLIHPEDRDDVWQDVQEAVAEDRPFKLVYRIHTREGREKWVWEQGRAVTTGSGERRLEGFITDITRQRQAEEQMRRHSERVTALSRAAARLNSQLDLESVLQTICAETRHSLAVPGVSVALYDEASETFRLGASDGLPDEVSDDADILTRYLDDFVRQDLHSPGIFSDFGTLASLCIHLLAEIDMCPLAYAVMERDTELVGVIVVHTVDCTLDLSDDELKLLQGLADQAAIAIDNARLFAETRHLLRKTQTHIRWVHRIADTVPEGMILLDSQQRILLANALAREYLTYLSQTEVGGTLTHLGARPLEPWLKEATNEGIRRELHLEREKRLFEVLVRPLKGHRPARSWVIVLRDVTDERRIQERARQQDRLAAVGQLAAGIAHDFNNVLGVITIQADLLRRQDLGKKVSERLQIIYEQARKASQLVGQILDFGRQSVVERHATRLLPFLNKQCRLLEHALPDSIIVRLTYSEGDYVVNADPARLQQALLNLAINARDAMPEGGKLHIELSRLLLAREEHPPLPDMQPGEYVRLSITDSGAGIARDALPHIFEPFYTTKSPGRGTGLGLAQVYGIVKQHEGHIKVESNLGEGTAFIIYLPPYEHLAESSEESAARGTPTRLDSEATILLVEDELATRTAIEETLQLNGYRVVSVENGRAALEWMTRHDSVDLVVSDLLMPEMGGLELYRTLQTDYPGLKVILMSGHPLDNEVREFLEEGLVTWLQKPFSAGQLVERLSQVLNDGK